MIWIRYNYLTPSVQDIKGKEDALKATSSQSKHYKQKAKRTVSFAKIGQTAIQNKNFPNKYMQRHKMTKIRRLQQKHRLGMVCKILIWGLGLGGGVDGWNLSRF